MVTDCVVGCGGEVGDWYGEKAGHTSSLAVGVGVGCKREDGEEGVKFGVPYVVRVYGGNGRAVEDGLVFVGCVGFGMRMVRPFIRAGTVGADAFFVELIARARVVGESEAKGL